MKHPNRVYSREQLLNLVWGYEYTGEYRTVDVHIRRLREKVEQDPANPTPALHQVGRGVLFQGGVTPPRSTGRRRGDGRETIRQAADYPFSANAPGPGLFLPHCGPAGADEYLPFGDEPKPDVPLPADRPGKPGGAGEQHPHHRRRADPGNGGAGGKPAGGPGCPPAGGDRPGGAGAL